MTNTVTEVLEILRKLLTRGTRGGRSGGRERRNDPSDGLRWGHPTVDQVRYAPSSHSRETVVGLTEDFLTPHRHRLKRGLPKEQEYLCPSGEDVDVVCGPVPLVGSPVMMSQFEVG